MFNKKKTANAPKYLIAEKYSAASIEAFHSIGTTISLSLPVESGKGGKVVAITSPMSEDGRTTVAVNVALMLTRSGARVAILDADMRKGVIHKFFGAEAGVGFSDCLADQVSVSDAIKTADAYKNLSFVTCGTKHPRPYELLDHAKFQAFLDELKQQFDYVIIDTPPALAVSDAFLFAQKADGTVVVCRHYKTLINEISKTLDSLAFVKAKVLGVVVNDYKKR